jgi:hypothetical protein
MYNVILRRVHVTTVARTKMQQCTVEVHVTDNNIKTLSAAQQHLWRVDVNRNDKTDWQVFM